MQVFSRFMGMGIRRVLAVPSLMMWSSQSSLLDGMKQCVYGANEKSRSFCSGSNGSAGSQGQQPSVSTTAQQPSVGGGLFDDLDTERYQISPQRRRSIEAKLRMKQYRREAEKMKRQKEYEEEVKNFQLDYSKIYEKGAPGTVQGTITEIIRLGYFVALPTGRRGFLSASHIGCSGGVELLERLFKVGQEITCRVIEVPNPGGADRVYIRPVGVYQD